MKQLTDADMAILSKPRKPIPGWEGFYETTECGMLVACERTIFLTKPNKGKTSHYKAKVVHGTASMGYLRASLFRSGTRRRMHIHHMVALAWIPNPLNLPHVNHKDGNKRNNHANNLEWITVKGNNLHSYRVLGRISNGGKRTVTYAIAEELRAEHGRGGVTIKALAKRRGIPRSTMSRIVNRKTYARPWVPLSEILKSKR